MATARGTAVSVVNIITSPPSITAYTPLSRTRAAFVGGVLVTVNTDTSRPTVGQLFPRGKT